MYPRPTSHSPALGWQLPTLMHPTPTTASTAFSVHPPETSGLCTPSCGAQACLVDGSALEKSLGDPRQHTKYPYVTGTSVIGIKYKDGVMIVADTLG